MAFIDPKTGLPITSRSEAQSASLTLLDIMEGSGSFPPEIVENLCGKALYALKTIKTNSFAAGMDDAAATNEAMSTPVTIELALLLGFLRDTLTLNALKDNALKEQDKRPSAINPELLNFATPRIYSEE